MRYLLVLAASLFLFSSCVFFTSPRQSIHQFKKYEQLEQLSQDTLFVIINTEKEDLALLEKYGKSKQAQRMQADLNKRNDSYKAAFFQYFTLAPVAFWEMSEHDYQLPNGFYADIALFEIASDESGMKTMMALQLKNNEDAILHSVSREFNPFVHNFNGIVKQFSKGLTRINKKGLELKQDATK